MDTPSSSDGDGSSASTVEPTYPDAGEPRRTPPTRTAESPLRTVLVAIGLVVGGILVFGVAAFAVGLPLFIAGTSVGVLLVVTTTIGQYVGFAGFGLLSLRYRGFDWDGIRSYLGLRWPSLRELGVVAGGYLAIVGLLAVVLSVVLRFLPEPAANEGGQAAAANPELVPVMIAVMFLVVGPCEELLFRGVVQNRLRETFSAAPAIGMATAMFAAIHVFALVGDPVGIAITVGVLFVPGLVLGVVYEYTGNLVVPWLLHSIHNSVLLSLILLAPGEAGGEEAGAMLTAIQSALAV